jgi:hypothetical protein
MDSNWPSINLSIEAIDIAIVNTHLDKDLAISKEFISMTSSAKNLTFHAWQEYFVQSLYESDPLFFLETLSSRLGHFYFLLICLDPI